MAELTIVTNNVPRDILNGWDLTLKERQEFDYLNWVDIEKGEDSASFFRYKDEVYDLQEFELVVDTRFQGWEGIRSDSFFSGIVVRYVNDDEQIVVGRYYS